MRRASFMPWNRPAFTLVEMLVVIAIIGVLAAILLPAIKMAQTRARRANAESDIGKLSLALGEYATDFGAFPPDRPDALPSGVGEPFENMTTPNECLTWFLTRAYSNSEGAGVPDTVGGNDWLIAPQNAPKIYASVTKSGYLDLKAESRMDFDGDGFEEFVDPWGRPYMYRAWPDVWRAVTVVSGSGTPELTFTLTVPADVQPLEGVRGRVEFRNFDPVAFNGVFDFEGLGNNQIKLQFAVNTVAPAALGDFRFPAHNRQEPDVYSLGPNGMTRGAQRPLNASGNPVPWKPQVPSEYGKWTQIWGSPGDGNDILDGGNLGLTDERDRDDINNW